ncbi:Y-family DNA polymerase [Dechloromonas denitrificans]|uniref:Y-family DNA polymerase n=1 Tax=Dechloromonas denitrificans TaxID=281362 RepID=UPI001CF8468B|nr:DNA polymerase Y family protein [Dechloromonas denitrificans]UCV01637.1 DNA polymerase Y family protein [Dechloromonas denitrificans]
MLWLALHFPLLPLEALPLRQSPSAVVSRGRVLACDRQAAEAGVKSGQKLSTALGLQPGLAVFEREAVRENGALESLACWAGRFTPTLSLAPPNTLLLEIGGCLRLFGGVEPIVDAVLAGCAEQCYSPTWAVAPTALGGRWLAQAGAGAIYREPAAMQAALAGLPCAVPGWPAEAQSRLASFGLKHLGDLQALPAAGLRRRIGSEPVDDLLRARGELPDPQQPFVFPESFAIEIELPARVERAEALAFAGQRLFAALAGWLHGRQLLVRACTLQLKHDDGSLTALVLRFAEPAADEGRFLRLLREQLARLHLAAPVEVLRLLADEVENKPGASAHLFDAAPVGEGALACLERLRARLGEAAVQMLGEKADYRPECASVHRDAAADVAQPKPSPPPAAAMPPRRPLWLLPAPQSLAERAGQPHWHGPLKLLSRAERLESGWWDEGEAAAAGDVRRDYFVARNPQGQWAWVFRDAQGWYLHGLFS